MPSTAKRVRTPAQLANDALLRSKGHSQFVRKNLLGPDDVKGVPEQDTTISTTGEAEATHRLIDVIQPEAMQSKAEDEAFMNELVEIQIEADDDPNAPLFVFAGHQGIPQYLQRGRPQTVKRKFLYSLIAAKQARLVCSFGRNEDGNEFNRLQGPKRTTHRVTILRDSEKGRQAYLRWMQEA